MKKIYLALIMMVLGFSVQAQRNIKVDVLIVKPALDTNLKTGGTGINILYLLQNSSATAADSIQAGDTLKFFTPGNPFVTGTGFGTYTYVPFPRSVRKDSIMAFGDVPAAATFAGIETLADMASLTFKSKPFTANTQYAWFLIIDTISKGAANLPIGVVTMDVDTQRIWINKSGTGIGETQIAMDVVTYPNPAVNQLSFEYNLATSATINAAILDMNGRRITAKEYQGNGAAKQKFDFDIAALPTGSYILKLDVDGKSVARQFNVSK
jgi:hypothetical protein